MKVARIKIAQAVADKTLKSGASKRLSRQIAAYLIAEGRTNQLNSVLRDVQADWAEAGYVEVLAASAHALNSSAKTDIKNKVKQLYPNAKQIIVTEVHDPSVIGGVRLSLADQQLDMTARAKLNQLKQLTDSSRI